MVDHLICSLLAEVSKGDLSLSAIGTTEAELEELRIEGCKVRARKVLDYLRKRVKADLSDYNYMIWLLQKESEDGGFSLSDIGTSEK